MHTYSQKLATPGDAPGTGRVVTVASHDRGDTAWQVSATRIKVSDANGNALLDGRLFGSSLVEFTDSGNFAAHPGNSGTRDFGAVLMTQAMTPPRDRRAMEVPVPAAHVTGEAAVTDTTVPAARAAVPADPGPDIVESFTSGFDIEPATLLEGLSIPGSFAVTGDPGSPVAAGDPDGKRRPAMRAGPVPVTEPAAVFVWLAGLVMLLARRR